MELKRLSELDKLSEEELLKQISVLEKKKLSSEERCILGNIYLRMNLLEKAYDYLNNNQYFNLEENNNYKQMRFRRDELTGDWVEVPECGDGSDGPDEPQPGCCSYLCVCAACFSAPLALNWFSTSGIDYICNCCCSDC